MLWSSREPKGGNWIDCYPKPRSWGGGGNYIISPQGGLSSLVSYIARGNIAFNYRCMNFRRLPGVPERRLWPWSWATCRWCEQSHQPCKRCDQRARGGRHGGTDAWPLWGSQFAVLYRSMQSSPFPLPHPRRGSGLNRFHSWIQVP